MAAPNIVNVTNITGVTTAVSLGSTSETVFLSNSNASNKVFKVNTIMISNSNGTSASDITINYRLAAGGSGGSVPIASTIVVPADASLVVIGKDNPIYLEENRSLTGTASAANNLSIICSYEDIS